MSRYRWLWYAAGVAMIGWGARGLIGHVSTTGLTHTGRLFAIDIVVHDGLFAPVAFVVAYLTQRILPPLVRTPVRVGLAFGGVLVLLAMPVLLSDHRLRSPSVLPLPYGRNLIILLSGVLAGVIVSVAVNLVGARARKPAPPPAR